MAHLRVRHLYQKLKKSLSQAPSVCLLGMRQTGKTTLLLKECKTYLTLDDDLTLAGLRDGNWNLIEDAKPPVALDECQKLPAIFDRIKLLIDRKKQMGRFLLTGSVRFLSKRQIKESLTGRSLILELLPMTLSESHSEEQRNIVATALAVETYSEFTSACKKSVWAKPSEIEHHLLLGGLPGICYKRDKNLRNSQHEQHIETLLNRDLPMLYSSRVSVSKLKELLRLIAFQQGKKISALGLSKGIRVSAPTIKALLTAFEGLFILRSLSGKYYFEDAGMQNFLLNPELLSKNFIYESFVFRELTALIKYQYFGNAELRSFFTRGGAEVPFVFSIQQKYSCAFTIDVQDRVSEKSLKSLGKLKKAHPRCKTLGLFLGDVPYEASNGVWCIPLSWAV